jgi:L-asparaginase/Glu-tRNA(Gln) amidotransferase subunit D
MPASSWKGWVPGMYPQTPRRSSEIYGYPGSEIDLIARHLTPAGYLSGLKARLLLALFLRSGKKPGTAAQAFAPYQ